jgi:hypothetical protein
MKPPISRPVAPAAPVKGSPPPDGAVALKIIKSRPPNKTAKDLTLFMLSICLENRQISSQLFTPFAPEIHLPASPDAPSPKFKDSWDPKE